MTTRWIAMAVSAFLFAGCGKKAGTSSEAPTPETQSAEPAPVGQSQASKPSPAEPAQADTGPLLDRLTWELRQYCITTHSVPSSLDVVAAAGFITNMPAPPAGKKYYIVPKKLQVVLVKE